MTCHCQNIHQPLPGDVPTQNENTICYPYHVVTEVYIFLSCKSQNSQGKPWKPGNRGIFKKKSEKTWKTQGKLKEKLESERKFEELNFFYIYTHYFSSPLILILLDPQSEDPLKCSLYIWPSVYLSERLSLELLAETLCFLAWC